MKAIIVAGGLGSRLSEETMIRPKPLVEIGDRPILWHILKIYSHYGVNDFIICLGYKGYMIKDYFANYARHVSDMKICIQNNQTEVLQNAGEPWNITLIDTGANTGTGGRLKQAIEYVKDDEFFHFTYGDGVGNIDIARLTEFHKSHDNLATVTATRPPKRFGVMETDGDTVVGFEEKPHCEGGWVNGGFFVLSPKVENLIAGDETYWEREPMVSLVKQGELRVNFHDDFWQPMDTLRDRHMLEELWNGGNAPWKIWD